MQVFSIGLIMQKMCVKTRDFSTFLDKFSEDLKECVGAFKAARLCLPHKVAEYNPTADTVDLFDGLSLFEQTFYSSRPQS